MRLLSDPCNNAHHGRGLNTHAGLCDQSPNSAPSRASTNLQRTGAKPLVSSASIVSSLGSLPFKMNGKVARYRSPRSSASRGGRMPRNPRADQIGTGGRIKSESPGGCARNAQVLRPKLSSGLWNKLNGLCKQLLSVRFSFLGSVLCHMQLTRLVSGIVRLKSFAIVFARISGWFQLLMFGESQSNIEICPIC